MNKIFGIGLSRTGTTSLSYVLNQVGLNIIHYPMSKTQLFDPNNDGSCDIPVITYYKELNDTFPNSKFIYTIREKEDWLDSMEKYLPRKKNWNSSNWQDQHRLSVYNQINFNRTVFAERYDFHDNDIRGYFKNRENDLLILDICGGETTERLFSFLKITDNNAPKAFSDKNKLVVK